MRTLAPAKINLYLKLLGRRADGYHDLDTVMYSLSFGDYLDLQLQRLNDDQVPPTAARVAVAGTFSFPLYYRLELTGLEAQAMIAQGGADPARDLCLRALSAWFSAADARSLPSLEAGQALIATLKLDKQIPAQAGLGGGSSDAAALLRMLEALLPEAQLGASRLHDLAAGIGADVPFCLQVAPAHCTGIGDVIAPLPSLPALPVSLIKPRAGISTAAAFARFDARLDAPSPAADGPALDGAAFRRALAQLAQRSDHDRQLAVLAGWRRNGGNDFAELIAEQRPWIPTWLAALARHVPRAYSGLSGSGTAAFVIHPENGDEGGVDAACRWFSEHEPEQAPRRYQTRLRARLPELVFD